MQGRSEWRRRAAAILVITALLTGCSAKPAPRRASPAELAAYHQVISAADRTLHQGSWRFRSTFRIYGIAGISGAEVLQGAIDQTRGLETLAISLPRTADSPPDVVRWIVIGAYSWNEDPAARVVLPPGKLWTREPTDGRPVGVGAGDPSSALAWVLGSSVSVDRLGAETVGGLPTVHYRMVVSLQRAVARSPTARRAWFSQQVKELGTNALRMDLWVDAMGRVRMEEFQIPITAAMVAAQGLQETPAPGAHAVAVFRYWDFGVRLHLSPPPSSEVATNTFPFPVAPTPSATG